MVVGVGRPQDSPHNNTNKIITRDITAMTTHTNTLTTTKELKPSPDQATTLCAPAPKRLPLILSSVFVAAPARLIDSRARLREREEGRGGGADDVLLRVSFR